MIVVQIQGVPGDVKIPGYDKDKWFVAESFGFGVGKKIDTSEGDSDTVRYLVSCGQAIHLRHRDQSVE